MHGDHEEQTDEELLIDTILNSIGEYSKKHSPISKKCQRVVDRGPVCQNGYTVFTEQRRYVMCRAFEMLDLGEADVLGEAMEMAWEEVRMTCMFDKSKSKEEEKEELPHGTYFPYVSCDPRSFRAETFVRPDDDDDHKICLLTCCPSGEYDPTTGECKTAVKVHSLVEGDVG